MIQNKTHSLFTEKWRPSSLNSFMGDEQLKAYFAKAIAQNYIQNYIFTGSPGTGKTTLAKILINNMDCESLIINMSDERGIDTVRDKIVGFASTMSFSPLKIIVCEECLDENTLVTVLRKGNIQQIPIRDLNEKNDLVKSFNTKKNRIEWKPFYLWDKGEQETYEIEFENGEIIICTPDHKWYVEDVEGKLKVVKTIELEDYMEIFNPKAYIGIDGKTENKIN